MGTENLSKPYIRAIIDAEIEARKVRLSVKAEQVTGTIIIPFSADPKYHFWNGGQPLLKTLLELNAPENIWGKHTEKPYPGNAA
jgi:hypothetical protein